MGRHLETITVRVYVDHNNDRQERIEHGAVELLRAQIKQWIADDSVLDEHIAFVD